MKTKLFENTGGNTFKLVLSEDAYDAYRDYKAGTISWQDYQDIVKREEEQEKEMERKAMDKDKGPWYIRINGKIVRVKGEPKKFDWFRNANSYALAIIKNKPEVKDKLKITRKPEDTAPSAPQTEDIEAPWVSRPDKYDPANVPDSGDAAYDMDEFEAEVRSIFDDALEQKRPIVYDSEIWRKCPDSIDDNDMLDDADKMVADIAEDHWYEYDTTIKNPKSSSFDGGWKLRSDAEFPNEA